MDRGSRSDMREIVPRSDRTIRYRVVSGFLWVDGFCFQNMPIQDWSCSGVVPKIEPRKVPPARPAPIKSGGGLHFHRLSSSVYFLKEGYSKSAPGESVTCDKSVVQKGHFCPNSLDALQ
jgi:hypothetical protein